MITDKVVQCVRHIIVLDDEIEIPSHVLRFSNLIRSRGYKLTETSNAADDVSCILYSSGTTGLPKGVMITHKNFLFNLIMNKLVYPHIIHLFADMTYSIFKSISSDSITGTPLFFFFSKK